MRDSVDDLIALARRGELDAAERRRLELSLGSSSEARLLHQAGLELDQAASVLPGDDALAERIKRRVMARVLPVAAPRRHRLLPWGIAAAVACVAMAAGGAVLGLRPLRAIFSTPMLTAPARVPAPPRPATVPVPPPAPLVSPLPEADGATDAAPVPVPVAPKAGQAPDAGSASELFASAASARRRGKAQEAMLLYDALQSRFPGSAEANAADMALGMLRLQRGSSRSALQHFTRYLSRNPRAELVPDALWGKAQALSSLGQRAEARRSYASLLERYPDSTYAAAARAKLEGSKPPP
jgi:tetratricopeptide (TPR) repeat protein